MAVLLISFLVLMILGCPIAFCLLCSGTLYFVTNDMALIMLVQRLTEGANTFTLLAVPGFILAGNLMNSGEVTDRIFDFCGSWWGILQEAWPMPTPGIRCFRRNVRGGDCRCGRPWGH